MYQYVEGRGRDCFPLPETMLRSIYTVQVLSSDDNAKSYTDDTFDHLYDFIYFSHDLEVYLNGLGFRGDAAARTGFFRFDFSNKSW